MKRLIFAPAFYNLAETTRAVEIAKASRHHFDCRFISYGGQFEDVVRQEGFEIHAMTPQLTPALIDHIYAVDKGEKRGDIMPVEVLEQRVANEIEFWQAEQPAAVLTGWSLGVYVSAPAAAVPLVTVVNSTWLPQYYAAGLGTWPDMFDFPILRVVPDGFLNWLMNRLMVHLPFFVGPFNKVAEQYDVERFGNMAELFLGDYSLIADVPEFAGLEAGPNQHFIGPLIGRLDVPIPDEIQQMPKDQPIVYFAMGSSGTADIIADILPVFAGQPYRVISPIKSLVEGLDLHVPANVIVTDWLPAHEVNPMADVSVIHGGIGTVMTACLSGTPVVGVGMQPEQEANLDCLVRKGFAIRISKRRATARVVADAIDALLYDAEAKRKAREFQAILQRWDNGGTNAARFLTEVFGDEIEAASSDSSSTLPRFT